jgi:mannose-6-phosphate isomerase-like protein (cupin superfamily)
MQRRSANRCDIEFWDSEKRPRQSSKDELEQCKCRTNVGHSLRHYSQRFQLLPLQGSHRLKQHRAESEVASGQDRFNKSRSIGVSSTTFKVATPDTGGALFAMEQANTKPGGPPLHLHHNEDEFWYVLARDYVIEVGSDQYRAQPGDCVLGPRNIPHAWAFLGESSGRLLIVYTTAGRIQNDAALYRAFGMELLGPPLSLKRTISRRHLLVRSLLPS